MFEIPKITAYRSKVVFQYALPIDSGNMRYNATRLKLGGKSGGFDIFINESEANYTETVWRYYIENRGVNFMETGAVAVYTLLNKALNGTRLQYDKDYLQARRAVLANAQSDINREQTNILFGTGKYASDDLKSQVNYQINLSKMNNIENLVNYGGI